MIHNQLATNGNGRKNNVKQECILVTIIQQSKCVYKQETTTFNLRSVYGSCKAFLMNPLFAKVACLTAVFLLL